MVASTVERVPQHTAEHINRRIQEETEENIARYAALGPAAIDRRLQELDREWDIERLLETNASIAMLLGLTLGATVDRRWFIFPALVSAFLLQHAVDGWCPPVPIMRRLGIRTSSEIDEERYALKALRGDFRALPGHEHGQAAVQQAMEAVRR
jgi:hypothetical protein